jgi:hypothetical protein
MTPVAKIVYQTAEDQAVICPHCEKIHIVEIASSPIQYCEALNTAAYRINGTHYSLNDIAKALVSRDKMILKKQRQRDIAKELIRGEMKTPS